MKKTSLYYTLILTFTLLIINNVFFAKPALPKSETNDIPSLHYEDRYQEEQQRNTPHGEPVDFELSFDKNPKRRYTFLLNIPWVTFAGSKTLESSLLLALRTTDYPIYLINKKAGATIGSLVFMTKSILIDYPLTQAALTFNHEFFGHAARVRETGGEVLKVKVNWAWPYGSSGGGYTEFIPPSETDYNIIITASGSEANTVFSQHIAIRWMREGFILPSDVVPYIFSRMDLFLYIHSTFNSDTFKGGDVEVYIEQLNNKYGITNPGSYKVKLDKIKNWSYLVLADPMLLMSVIATFYTQFSNKRYMKTLMLPLGKGLSFIPSMRLALTPFGPEWYTDLFFRLPDKSVIHVYARIGSKVFKTNWGFGIRAIGIKLSKRFEIGGGIDIFSQPEITENAAVSNGYNAEKKLGMAIYIDTSYQPLCDLFRIHLRLGYKTEGYVFGMNIKKGLIWHIGTSFYF